MVNAGSGPGVAPEHSAPPASSSPLALSEHEAKHLGGQKASLWAAFSASQPCWEPSPKLIRDGVALREAVEGGRKEKAQGWLIQLGSYRDVSEAPK